MKKKLPIGIDSFREIREIDKYYIDKTLFIRDFIQTEDKVSLITRPRRFGKTLNLTMLRDFLKISIVTLEQAVSDYYKITPILLIDEYDQPMMSNFEHGYHDALKEFFAGFYGAALKGQDCLHQALLTGIQRIVKESVFSLLNNIRVYTVIDERFSTRFGLTSGETEKVRHCA